MRIATSGDMESSAFRLWRGKNMAARLSSLWRNAGRTYACSPLALARWTIKPSWSCTAPIEPRRSSI